MKRLVHRGLIALAVIALWATGSLIMQWGRADSLEKDAPAPPRAIADQTQPTQDEPPASHRPDLDLGVQLSAHHGGRVQYADRVMERLHEAGAGWVRVDVGWATLQSAKPGAFDRWYADDIDQVLASARKHELKVILMFWLTPSWASPNGSLYAPPDDVSAYAAAVGKAARRWGHLVDAWEIWNEPNFDGFFEGADPETYTQLLCAAYPAVKQYDDAPVLFGGIMYNDDAWLKKAYEAGAQPCFDALATHPYIGPSDAAPETPSVGAVWRLTSTPAMHKLMKEWGDGQKQIWITELGWSTGTDNDGNTWDRPVTAREQADFLARAVRLIRKDYPYVGPIIWYRDVDGPSDHYQDGFGLMRPDLSPKRSMRAFRSVVRGDG